MDIKNNIKEDDVAKIIAKCNMLPKRNHIMVTLNQIKEENSELEFTGEMETMLDEWQYVIASGTGAEYKPGDKVFLDVARMIKRVQDPENTSRYIDRLDATPVPLGDNVFTIIGDGYVLAKEFDYETVDIKA